MKPQVSARIKDSQSDSELVHTLIRITEHLEGCCTNKERSRERHLFLRGLARWLAIRSRSMEVEVHVNHDLDGHRVSLVHCRPKFIVFHGIDRFFVQSHAEMT
jgi:hypothetical protein